MNLFAEIKSLVIAELKVLQNEGYLPDQLDFYQVSVEPPRDAAHGDMASNAAMVLAKAAGKNPRAIAAALRKKLLSDPRIMAIEVVAPGFLNFFMKPKFWYCILPVALRSGADFGRINLGKNQRVNIEFVSANPTGPLHVAHARGAVFGDVLARLLNFVGYNVTREYYINDAGAQVDILARSAYLRYLEANQQNVCLDDTAYPGDYLITVGQKLKKKYKEKLIDKPKNVWLPVVRQFAVTAMMDMISDDLERLGVTMDVFFSEKSLYENATIETALQILHRKGLIYEGILKPPKGKITPEWQPYRQTLFKSTVYGDDSDRPVKKSNGDWTYFAPDIAYHYDKIHRDFDLLINVLGADHSGYVRRMQAVVTALSNDRKKLNVKLIQLVRLYDNGKPYKMSKRSGRFVTLADLIDKIGTDVIRFVMLTRRNDAPLDFDFQSVLQQSKDNPVFYVQYAHARIISVIKKAKAMGIISQVEQISPDMLFLTHKAELTVLKKIAQWPRLLELAAQHNEPHRIAFYLQELATAFHKLWTLGHDIPSLRFLQQDTAVSMAKLILISAVQATLVAGLGILGVTPIDELN